LLNILYFRQLDFYLKAKKQQIFQLLHKQRDFFMSQSNLNNSLVLNNNGFNVLAGGNTQPFPSSHDVETSAAGVNTVLSNTDPRNTDGMDFNTENGDYDVATALHSGKFLNGTASTLKMSDVLGNYVNNVQFLPTEQVAKTEWNAAAITAGSYLDGTTWKAPSLNGNASAFTLSTTDTGRTVTLTETISGAPFTTGNGAVNEALTFRGANNDTLAIKHSVNVANVPALTNNNNGSALDVRNESYAETYAKQGVSSNYAWNSTHRYAEANGNQTLNDAFAETYAYRDAGLTITSSVKTSVADAAHINGSEKIAENRAANYSYKAASGTVDYVVTDTRNLTQVDQRTWTNQTVTNVAKFEVVDNTNGTKITAKGLITGTTDNISTAKAAATPTTFKATNAEFKVDSANYSLVVDPKEFNTDHAGVAANALLTLVNATATPTANVFDSALGTVPAGQVSMADAFNPYVSTVGAVTGARLDGTQFNDIITVKDSADKPFNAVINAGAGNDKITGGFGNDVLTGGTGADTFIVTAGNDTITDFELGVDALTIQKGTATANVTIVFADNTKAKYIVTGNANSDVVIPTTNADGTALTKAGLALIAGVKAENVFDFSSSTKNELIIGDSKEDTRGDGAKNQDTLIGGSGNDTLDGGLQADVLTGNAGADTFRFSHLTNGVATRVDTITDFSKAQGDKIDVSALGFKSFIGSTAFTAANSANALRFDSATQTLQGNTGDLTRIELEIKVIGDAPTAADFIFA
jgi:Ca2+-binding RTX toxin-like protein